MMTQIRLAVVVALLSVTTAFSQTQPMTVSRYIEFRDGSVMHLPVVNEPWKFTLIQPSGKIETTSLLPADISNLVLTDEQDFAKKRQLLSYVLQMGADDFQEREAAWEKIAKLGPSICPDLKACIPLTQDVEIQARLYALINKLYVGDPKTLKARIVFDRFETKIPLWGYLEESPIVVVVKGKSYSLNRKEVARVSSVLPGSRVSVQRVLDKDFPPDCIEEDFETDPLSGQKLKEGDNVEKMFISKGFTLSSSYKKSYVAANKFTVSGKSGGMSVANWEPMWEGSVTIRFCQPGKEHIPAAVDYFGCYLASVIPNGTYLVAYDMQDRELGKIATQQSGTEFLAVKSDIPIHKISIVPTDEDPNYTLDDFIFHFANTAQASHPDKALVEMLAGDLILCKDVVIKDGRVELHGITAGLPNLDFALTDVARVNPPQTPKVHKHEGLFAELDDGSILFAPEAADKRSMPVFARDQNLLKDHKDVVGIWTTKSGRKVNPPLPPDFKTVMWDVEAQQWFEVDYLRFLEEVVLWKKTDGKFGASGYERFTTIWFAKPRPAPEPGSWHVQTVNGEDLVLVKNILPAGQLSKGITATWRGQPITLPPSQIMSLYQVPSKK